MGGRQHAGSAIWRRPSWLRHEMPFQSNSMVFIGRTTNKHPTTSAPSLSLTPQPSTNIQSMKVVASTKLTRAEKAMREAKKYGAANNELFTHTLSAEGAEPKEPKVLYLAVSSDGGLCGGIHSGLTRAIKRETAKQEGRIAVVGDKPKAQLSRAMPEQFALSFAGVGKDVPTFAEASVIADEIIKSGGDFDEVSLLVCTLALETRLGKTLGFSSR